MRDGRWDGRGPLFNLLLAAGLVPNVLSALLESLKLPAGIAQPLGLVLAVDGPASHSCLTPPRAGPNAPFRRRVRGPMFPSRT